MSCFVCSDREIKTLAESLCAMVNYKDFYSLTGISVPESVYRVLDKNGCLDSWPSGDANKTAAMLYAENVKAYNWRYPEHKLYDEAPDFSKVNVKSLVSLENPWHDGYHEISQWYFDLLILCEMYKYQIAEDATYKGDIYKMIGDVIHALQAAIAHNDPHYNHKGGWLHW